MADKANAVRTSRREHSSSAPGAGRPTSETGGNPDGTGTVVVLASGYLKLSASGQPTLKVRVRDAAAASVAMRTYLHPDAYTYIGASEMKRGCGDLVEDGGQKIGRVSYNGRVWDLHDVLLYDPYPEGGQR